MYRPNLILAASLLLGTALASMSNAQVSPQNVLSESSSVQSTISTDFTLPVTLDSKSQTLDGKNKTSIFTDSVVIRQGSLELLANKVEVDASKGTGKEIIIASGQPASYKQRKEDGSLVEAQANEITYTIESRTISLNGNALIMQNEVKVSGDLIVFDMIKEQILASTNVNSNDSVRTVISPGVFSSEQDNKPTDNQDKP